METYSRTFHVLNLNDPLENHMPVCYFIFGLFYSRKTTKLKKVWRIYTPRIFGICMHVYIYVYIYLGGQLEGREPLFIKGFLLLPENRLGSAFYPWIRSGLWWFQVHWDWCYFIVTLGHILHDVECKLRALGKIHSYCLIFQSLFYSDYLACCYFAGLQKFIACIQQ